MRKACIVGLTLALVIPRLGIAQDAEKLPLQETEGHAVQEAAKLPVQEPEKHPLKVFIEENQRSPERVTSIQSSASKRTGKVLLGVLGGAVLGAAHAHVTGGNVARGAAIGAAAGGALAFAITKIHDRRLAKRDEVVALVSYDPVQGYRGGVGAVRVTPGEVKPGEKITITTSYWVLGPSEQEAIGMSRYAGIAFSGAYLKGFTFKPDPMKFDEGGGQFETSMEVQLPDTVNPGTYNIVWLLDGKSVSTTNETTFVITG